MVRTRSHRIFPPDRRRQIIFSVVPTWPVRKMRSSQMHGDELPAGRAVFQCTFRSGPKFKGMDCPTAMALPPGPRNCDHWGGAADKVLAVARTTAMGAALVRIGFTRTAGVLLGLWMCPEVLQGAEDGDFSWKH